MSLVPVLTIAGLLAATPAVASGEIRVHPSANPSRPAPSEDVVIRFRTRDTLDGVYYVEAALRRSEPGCGGRVSPDRPAPSEGKVMRFRLRPPRATGERRWCAGSYRARVFFWATVHCPPKATCGGSVAFPIGSTTFTVS